MDFADTRKANFYATAFTHFGVWVTFSRSGQDDRQIKVNFRRTAADVESEYYGEQVDTAEVTVGRDEEHELGGVKWPQQMDKITRAGDDDGPFVWTGEVVEETPHSFVLKFMRPRLRRIGQKPGV